LIIIDHHFTSHFACPEFSGTALTCQSSLKVDGSHATALPLELLGLLAHSETIPGISLFLTSQQA
jgi:hypothetical protein